MEDFIRNRITVLRQRINDNLAKAYRLIDEAKDARYDFIKVAIARGMIDGCVELNDEIKRLELRLKQFA